MSALFLTFALLYSPIYLVSNARRILDPQAWIDHREVHFYLACFLVLCGLITLGLLHPTAALIAFILLSGFGHLFWRLIV